MNSKYKTRFLKVKFTNRWRIPDYSREDNWTIIGLSVFHFSNERFHYKICFFGLQVNLHFKREFIAERGIKITRK